MAVLRLIPDWLCGVAFLLVVLALMGEGDGR